MNCPFSIQVGVRDYYSESALRCIRAAEFEQVLNDYHDRLGYGYEHQVLVRVPNGHSFNDYSDDAVNKPTEEFWDTSEATVLANPTAYANPDVAGPMMTRFMEGFEVGGNRDVSSSSTEFTDISDLSYRPGYREFDEGILKIVTEEFHLELKTVNGSSVHYVSQFTRDPAPSVVVWDLSTRAPKRETTSFYWLRADYSVDRGEILVKAGDGNTITVTPENVNGDFSILIHPSLIDVSQPVHFIIPEGEVVVTVNPSEETLRNSIRETGDPCLAWVAEIPYSLLIGDE